MLHPRQGYRPLRNWLQNRCQFYSSNHIDHTPQSKRCTNVDFLDAPVSYSRTHYLRVYLTGTIDVVHIATPPSNKTVRLHPGDRPPNHSITHDCPRRTASSAMASTMGRYPVHRQRFP